MPANTDRPAGLAPNQIDWAYELAIVVPTYNERDNIEPLIARLQVVLSGVNWQLVFVDDNSPDGTASEIALHAKSNSNISCVHRFGRRGLASACIEGILASSAPTIAVMDADMQHDEALLPQMLERIRAGDKIVAASRYLHPSSMDEWDKRRRLVSRAATLIGRSFLHQKVTDPASGFFMIRRAAFDGVVDQLSGRGFKILYDLLSSLPPDIELSELPYKFRNRQFGKSKISLSVTGDYLLLIAEKTLGQWLPARFVMFGIVGGAGVIVHMIVLALILKGLAVRFELAQTAATITAMTTNYIFNNLATFADQHLQRAKFFSGLIKFYLACSIGALVNLAAASSLFHYGVPWPLAGLIGIALASVWNYAMSVTFIWKQTSK